MFRIKTSILTLSTLLMLSAPALAQRPHYEPPGRQRDEHDWERYEQQRRSREQNERRVREERARTADTRHTWTYAGGSFTDQGNGQWVEQNQSVTVTFSEVRRTPEFVEVYDASRDLYVRFFANAYYQRVGISGQWQVVTQGGWR